MAVATATPTVTQQYQHGDGSYEVIGSVAVTANPDTYATGGITCSFLQAKVKASRTPAQVTFTSRGGYQLVYVPGTTAGNGLLKVMQQNGSTGPLTELSAAAIPAALSGDTIGFRALFNGNR